jgi:hypothetical protein
MEPDLAPVRKPEKSPMAATASRDILDGCVLEESFSGESGMHLQGHSVSVIDPQDKRWKRTWVDNEGSYLDYVGGIKDGQMSFWRR